MYMYIYIYAYLHAQVHAHSSSHLIPSLDKNIVTRQKLRILLEWNKHEYNKDEKGALADERRTR